MAKNFRNNSSSERAPEVFSSDILMMILPMWQRIAEKAREEIEAVQDGPIHSGVGVEGTIWDDAHRDFVEKCRALGIAKVPGRSEMIALEGSAPGVKVITKERATGILSGASQTAFPIDAVESEYIKEPIFQAYPEEFLHTEEGTVWYPNKEDGTFEVQLMQKLRSMFWEKSSLSAEEYALVFRHPGNKKPYAITAGAMRNLQGKTDEECTQRISEDYATMN